MGITRVLFKKIRDTKGIFQAKMDTIKERKRMDPKEAEDLRKGGKNILSSVQLLSHVRLLATP